MANATPASSLDAALAVLQAHKNEWARLSIHRKIALLIEVRANLRTVSQRWVDASVEAKQIDPASPWVGEEWVTGPWAFAAGIDGYLATLTELARGRPVRFTRVTRRANGQLVVRVFPPDLFGWLPLNGLTAEVWMQPGVT
jgi:aldehyde dehydrogenase (NAD(P)+)